MIEPLLVNIAGPTAVGKTALAIQVARYFGTEIISSDSRQCYREVSIGTAKPSPEELALVRHHFIDHISINDPYSAGDFAREARIVLEELFRTHRVVIMTGGSGLYIDALTKGLDALPERNEKLRAELHLLLEEKGLEGLQELLKNLNEESYRNVELKNPQRVMRAIEIEKSNTPRKPGQTTLPFRVLNVVLNLPREILYDRIHMRVDQMMEKGLPEEVRSMLPYRNTYAMQTVGYSELFDYLDGVCTLQKAVDKIKQHTRNYAKRQLTWFRRTPDAVWFSPHDYEAIVKLIEGNLK